MLNVRMGITRSGPSIAWRGRAAGARRRAIGARTLRSGAARPQAPDRALRDGASSEGLWPDKGQGLHPLVPVHAADTSWRRAAAALLLAVLAAASGCESSSPTAPTSGALQVVVSAPVIRTGDTATATASQAGSAVTAAWSSSDGSVAMVSPAGLITAVRPGRATITATAGSGAGSVAVRVVPDFAGRWTGPLFRAQISCSFASTAPVCVPTTPPAVLLAPATLTLTQTGAEVTGTLVDGADPLLTITLEGRVADDDVLVLEGTSGAPLPTAPQRRVSVSAFRATFDPTVRTLSGSYTATVVRVSPDDTPAFDHSFQAQFRDLPRQ